MTVNKAIISLASLLFIQVGSHAAPIADIHYDVYVTKPITDLKILPATRIDSRLLSRTIKMSACRGEYEPATFTIRSIRELSGLTVEATDLVFNKERIPASAVDVRVVKCWYQAGTRVYETGKRLLVPELLLKYDGLIWVDHQQKHNYLRLGEGQQATYALISGPEGEDISNIAPADTSVLQPVTIEANTNKQFWITVHVPENTETGLYEGKLILTARNALPAEIEIALEVPPFELEKPDLRYAMYYRGRIARYNPGDPRLGSGHRNNRAVLNSNWKTRQQYRAEMENLKAHGIDYPTVYQNDELYFQQEMAIRKEVGLPTDSIYSLGAQTGNFSSEKALNDLRFKVRKWVKLAEQQGCQEMYFYGIDEAKGDLLLSQQRAWGTVREAGGKVFAAIHKGGAASMGEFLDTAIVPGPLDHEEAARYHALGRKIFSYSNPQVGEENPDVYRRNYGVRLWKAGYDGAMNYAYQHSANHIWNDFDDSRYRDHVFAYPTAEGVIDTVQFEGFREGVDDVRYLTTLRGAIKNALSLKPVEAAKAQQWLDNLDPDGDLWTMRHKIISWVNKLVYPIKDGK